MVGCCFKITVFVGFAISIWDFVTDIMATYDLHQTLGDYSERADTIAEGISGEGDSNFKADSTFFTTLSAEYESLSDFDKEYVYCDVGAIQSNPDALLKETKNIFIAACVFVGLSLIALGCGYWHLFGLIRRKEIYNGRGASSAREKLWNFNSKSAIQFVEAGPQLCLLWMMIMRVGQLNGYVCHEKFFNCGLSGDCTMSDLMVPVALNSALVDMAMSDIILAVSFAAGLFDVIWNFLSGCYLFISEGAPKMLVMPCLQLTLSTLPLFWIIYIDGLIPTGRTSDDEGIVVIVVAIFLTLCFCCSAAFFAVVGFRGSWKVNVDEVTRVRSRSSTIGL